MTEIVAAPKKGHWAVLADRTDVELRNDLVSSGHRLISIKSYTDGSRRLYAGCAIENSGVVTDWSPRISKDDLTAELRAVNGRVIALDAYVDAGTTYCSAAWVVDGGRSYWDVDLTVSQLSGSLEQTAGQLTCLRAYDGALPNEIRYAAVWVERDGRSWDWHHDTDFDTLYYRLKNGPLNNQSIVSWDSFVLGGNVRFSYVTWEKAAEDGWYYATPIEGSALKDYVRGLCSYPFDVCRSHPNGFGIVQHAYPPLGHPNARKLLTFGGNGVITGVSNGLFQNFDLSLEVKNTTSGAVTIEKAVRFFPGPGGWCLFDSGSWNQPNAGATFGAPAPTLPAGGAAHNSPPLGWLYSEGMEYGAAQVEAASGTLQQQEFAIVPLVERGGTPSTALADIAAPVFVGVQGPLEVLRMTDGRRLIEIKGQVVNFAGRDMRIRGIHIDLLDTAGKSVYFADVPLNFKLDVDVNAMPAASEYDYDKANSDHRRTPLPRFHYIFEAPAGYSNGSLEISLHIQTQNFYTDVDPDSEIGTMECFHSHRLLPVNDGRIQPIVSPVKGRFLWNNGPGANGWHTHSYPSARYAYDIVKVDENGNKNVAGTDGSKNEHSLSWGAEIRSASAGEVIFVENAQPDNPPGNPSGDANAVIIQNGQVRYLYWHLQKGSVRVNRGDMVAAGQVIGLLGNSGNSSGPHLHFAVNTSNDAGALRPLAVAISPPRGLPLAVPIDGATIDAV